MNGEIFLVDDNSGNLSLLAGILRGVGLRVRAANTGKRALTMIRAQRPELVMLDITMPERNGMGALNHIMATSPEARVIMCSALGEETVVKECIDTGAKAFVVKPFDPAEVVSAVGEALAA